MERRRPSTEPVLDQDGSENPELRAERLYAFLQSRIGAQARQARTMDDAARIAEQVSVLKSHPLQVHDLVSSADLDGSDAVQHALVADDGSVIALEEPRVLCGAHDDLTPWPCPVVSALAAEFATAAGFRAEDWSVAVRQG